MISYLQMKAFESAGVRFEVNGEELIIDAPAGLLTREQIEYLGSHKDMILLMLKVPLDPIDLRDLFQERAAILESDFSFSRKEAELQARYETLYRYVLSYHPSVMEELLSFLDVNTGVQ